MRHHWLSVTVLSVLATALLSSLATPLALPWDDVRVKHAWNAVPANWESLGPPPPGTTTDLHIALKPHNENSLVDSLHEVSSPGHQRYGAHLSKEEVAKLVAPHPDTLELVHSWLAHHGIPSSAISLTHGGGWLTLTGVPVSQANKMLSASYQLYQHAGKNDSMILRTVGYGLPTVLHTHVQSVAPTTHFASMHTQRQTARRPSAGATAALANVGSREPVSVTASGGEELVAPEFLRWLYGTIGYVPTATDQNALGVVGFMNEDPSPTDLTAFMSIFRTNAVAATFTVEECNGGEYNPSDPGFEGNLYMQHAQAIAYPTPHIHYSTAGGSQWISPSNEPAPGDVLLAWFDHVLGQERIPQTVIISHGHDEKDIPLEYARTVCDLFAQLGTRGVSAIFSTGNNGVGAGDCKVNGDSGKVQFQPMFPASCPWVTSVGGTTSAHPEVAAGISGGGFSKHFERPSYQSEAVPDFLERLGSQYHGLYNADGRGIPDISAQALNVEIVTGPIIHTMDGTGCALPIVAGIISLLNDYLLSNGKPPLGFLNPWLYGDGLDGINDIISGSNPGCGTGGFSAVAGWDPVTGLGTPDFDGLQDVLYDVILQTTEPTETPIPSRWFGTPTPMPTPRA